LRVGYGHTVSHSHCGVCTAVLPWTSRRGHEASSANAHELPIALRRNDAGRDGVRIGVEVNLRRARSITVSLSTSPSISTPPLGLCDSFFRRSSWSAVGRRGASRVSNVRDGSDNSARISGTAWCMRPGHVSSHLIFRRESPRATKVAEHPDVRCIQVMDVRRRRK
jgi:hypothetical protein